MKNKMLSRILTMLIIFVMLVSQFPATVYAETSKNSGNRIMVSMGDSFSSGEGVEEFYNQGLSDKEKAKNEDFLAHRSEKSWPGKLELNGKAMSLQKDNWYFVASSGAETKHFNGEQKKTYNRNNVEETTYLPKQLSVFDQFEKNEVDYVTMTIGGNDVGFSKIVETAATPSFLCPTTLSDELNTAWEGFYAENGDRENIRQAYIDVQKAAGEEANIIVAGYPKLIASIPIPQPFFSISEAKQINDSVSKFNDEIESIVEELSKEGKNIHFVSVEDAFSGHEAYSINSYINGIKLNQKQDLVEIDKDKLKKTSISAYSMHPNEKGTDAYAKCVQDVIDDIESESGRSRNNAGYFDAAQELIYNFPKYGFEVVEHTSNIEIIDLDEDGIPEIIFSNNYRANHLIGGVYYFNGDEYVEASYDSEDGTMYPIYPAIDSKNQVKFFSNNFSTTTESKSDLEFVLEGNAAYYTAYVSYSLSYSFDNHNLSYDNIFDLTDYVMQVADGDRDAIDTYISKLEEFNKQYQIDQSIKYIDVLFSAGTLLGVEDIDERLNLYHEIITEDIVNDILSCYAGGEHSYNLIG